MSEKDKIVKSFQGLLKVRDNEEVFNQLYELNDKNIELEKKSNWLSVLVVFLLIGVMVLFLFNWFSDITPMENKTKTIKIEKIIDVPSLQKQVISENEQLEQERCSKIGRNNPYGIKCFQKKCGKGHCNYDEKSGDYYINYENENESRKAWDEINKN